MKLSEVTQIYHLPQALYFYRSHSDNITSNQQQTILWAKLAIEQALGRRRLTESYQLEVDGANRFKLVPRHSNIPSSDNSPLAVAPLVSIIIPCYNAAARIESCLKSCLQQTYPRLEIIIVDNNSTDGTTEILHKYAQTMPNRWHVVNCSQQGANFARNVGYGV